MGEVFRGVNAGRERPGFWRYFFSVGCLRVNFVMRELLRSRGVRPSWGVSLYLEGDFGVDDCQRKGLEKSSLRVGARNSAFGGDGVVGGEPSFLSSGRGRPMRLAIKDLRSGDLLRPSSSCPESASVAVSVAAPLSAARWAAFSLARALLAALFCVAIEAAGKVLTGSTLSSRFAPLNSSRHRTPFNAPASSSAASMLLPSVSMNCVISCTTCGLPR